MDRQAQSRFKRYAVVQANGCWLWSGEGSRDGYGIFRPHSGIRVMTHVWSYETFNGPIPEGMDVGHACHDKAVAEGTCDGGEDCPHRRCCNPAHLEAQTRSQNTIAQNHANRNKETCPKGHTYTPENTITRADGKRRCRECDLERKRAARRRRAAEPDTRPSAAP